MKPDDLLAKYGISSPPVDVLGLAGAHGIRVTQARNPEWDVALNVGPPGEILGRAFMSDERSTTLPSPADDAEAELLANGFTPADDRAWERLKDLQQADPKLFEEALELVERAPEALREFLRPVVLKASQENFELVPFVRLLVTDPHHLRHLLSGKPPEPFL